MLCEDGKKMYITGTVFVKGAVPMVHCILSPNYCVCFAMWAVASLCNVSSRVTLQCEHSHHFAMWALASLCNVSSRVTLQCEQSCHCAMWAVASICNVSSHVILQCQQSHHSQQTLKLFYFQYFHLTVSCCTVFLRNLQQYSLHKKKISE